MEEEISIAEAVDPSVFPFSKIEIYTNQQLGRGSYGFVCKAKCDKLLCAAKLLHNVFFLSHDPGTKEVIQKFREECRILSTIVHPCIVQFLGVAMLGEQPVLLTELMDESMMSFIARSTDSQVNLSFRYEVDIVHDVAMGLSYLHSRKILHRDLSSNNVLLSRGCKAKITDFGVSKFFDANGSFSTISNTKYLTRCPGTAQFMPPESIRNADTYSDKLDIFSFGVICLHLLSKCPPNPGPDQKQEIDSLGRKIFVSIPEMQRREYEISKISPNHSLLPVSVSMIADEPCDRPTADEVCDTLSEIKSTKLYTDSANEPSNEERLLRELKHYRSEKQKLENELMQKQLESGTVERRVPSDDDNSEVEELRRENDRLQKELKKLQKDDSSPKERRLSSASTDLPPTSRENSFTRSSDSGQVWSELKTPLPCCFNRGTAACIGDKVFLSRGFSAVVHELDVKEKVWDTLSPCITEEFSLIVFDGHLLAVGGLNSRTGSCCKLVQQYNLSGAVWESSAYPTMFYPRALPACASNQDFLVVAGGSNGRPPTQPLNSVEIYSKQKGQWYCAYSLPVSLSSPVSVIKDDELYVVGGTSKDGPTWAMYHCSLSALFQWSNRHLVPVTMRQHWQSIQLPVASPAAVLVNDRIYLFGGTMGNDDGYHEYSNHMLKYKQHKGNFGISIMPRSRSACLAVTLSDNSVMVLGGCGTNDCINIANNLQ